MRAMILAAGLALAAGPALAADPAEGEWLTPAGSAKVRISPCAANATRLCGLVTWMKSPSNDIHNPNAAQRSKPIVGSALIRDFKQAAPGRWTGGKIYNPEDGKTYNSKITINADGTLKVEGCILMVCQAQTWRRS